MTGPVVLPGVLTLTAAPRRPGLVLCTFHGDPPLMVHIPTAKVQHVLTWWQTIAPELAVDGWMPDEAIEQFRADIIAAAVPDDLDDGVLG